MNSHDQKRVWNYASSVDSTLRISPSQSRRLAAKHIRAVAYSRETLFDRMTQGRVSLFRGVPIEVRPLAGLGIEQTLGQSIRKAFPRGARARVQLGREARRSALSINRLLDIWESRSEIISTNDLHFRDTSLEHQISAQPLSDFNLLCAEKDIDPLEMMTIVISSAGNVTDSHSDDADGSNHCLVGQKLWLAWDRLDGQAGGLQDVSHDDVTTMAVFDMNKFLSLPSSRWWVIGPGETLFLPGHLTHKVITLEHYIGFGSFHVAFPAYLRTITRWILYHTSDVTAPALSKINGIAVRQLRRLRRAPSRERRKWGLHLLTISMTRWRGEQFVGKERVLEHPVYRSFVAEAV